MKDCIIKFCMKGLIRRADDSDIDNLKLSSPSQSLRLMKTYNISVIRTFALLNRIVVYAAYWINLNILNMILNRDKKD